MQTLTRENVFAGIETPLLQGTPAPPSSETSFDTFHGLVMAGLLGTYMWAAVLLLCWWIWL